MSDYIKREDAIQAFDPRQRQDWYTPWIVETLEGLPSADVAPVRRGRWIFDYGNYYCSECNEISDTGYETNYCPNCGAKMDEEKEDEL